MNTYKSSAHSVEHMNTYKSSAYRFEHMIILFIVLATIVFPELSTLVTPQFSYNNYGLWQLLQAQFYRGECRMDFIAVCVGGQGLVLKLFELWTKNISGNEFVKIVKGTVC